MADRVDASARDLRAFAAAIGAAEEQMDNALSTLLRGLNEVDRTWRDPQKESAAQAIEEFNRSVNRAKGELDATRVYCLSYATHLEQAPGMKR